MASALALDVERDQVGSVQSSTPLPGNSADGEQAQQCGAEEAGTEQLELALRSWPTKRLNDALAELGPARPASVIRLADLPPPSRPQRTAPDFLDAEEIRQSAIPDLGNARLAEDDVAGGELVRALASLPPTLRDATAGRSGVISATADSLAEESDRPPMIIERARAEQTLARLTGPLEISRLSPAPGLVTGFALSLVAGAALFLLMG